MNSADLQQVFFSNLKNIIPANISMVDEIADILNLGYDSVYRRIRGEKPITLGELKILCDRYHISLDQVLQLNNDSVVFQAPGINNDLDFPTYLNGILAEFKHFNSFKNTQMHYLCKDLPIWHYFHFPEIAAFKIFCWLKTIQNHPDYQHRSFSLKEFTYEELFKTGQQILKEYNKIPTIELWSYETVNSTINQMQYYRDANLFVNDDDFRVLIDSLSKVIDHLSNQAEHGVKYMPGTSPETSSVHYKIYINEVLLGNNTTLMSLDNTLYSYINYNGLNYFKTKDTRFTSRSLSHFNTLVSRSTLISGTGEKYRNKYFSKLDEQVNNLHLKHQPFSA
jgi:BetR domain